MAKHDPGCFRAWQLFLALAAGLTFVGGAQAAEAPVVFWAPDQAGPGDVILVYGGNLAAADAVVAWRLPDGSPALPPAAAPSVAPADAPRLKPLQRTDNSLKFLLPEILAPGVFAVQVIAGAEKSPARLLNRPELWFLQPTALRPGLAVNQAPPGMEVQVIGKNLTIRGDGKPPRLALRPKAGGPTVAVPVVKAEPFSLTARLPEDLPARAYRVVCPCGQGRCGGVGGAARHRGESTGSMAPESLQRPRLRGQGGRRRG